jgi:DNA polymerase-3 subunit alpha (Gram-positive type)
VRHIILIARNAVGLKNLYKLVSLGHIKYMDSRKRQIMPRHEIEKHREGLLIGSACEAGELYRAVLEGKSHRELREIARFYDFLEIQPAGNNEFLIREGTLRTIEEIQNINQKIVALGKELGIPVVATGDVHFLDPEDEVYRRIIMAGKGFEDADMQAPLFLKTTNEMLEEFSYLGAETAYKVVVENTNLIAEMCEEISPVPKGMFPPELKGSAEELTALTYAKAHALYGETLPEIVKKRVERELKPIIANGFDVMYMIAQKLIKRSNESGYLVGSRGSVGSSVVAFFAGITEINALPPHYRCPKCRYSEFHPGEGLGCGLDLPDKACPACGEKLVKDGFDIPFETFLGFDGDKAPDIDLNFSGEEDQAAAHRQTTEMFGKDNVFRAGTIGTLGAKPAFGYVHKYCESRGIVVSKAEEERLIKGCMDVKKTTGQHPGGLIIVPQNKEIYDFCPIQYPADDPSSGVFTTHVDYHSIDANLLKLDLLGKDDPTILRYLEDVTGVRVEDIPLDDPEVMELFLSNRPLGIESDEITGPNGALGIPEYGTGFVRGMLAETNPRTISDLVRISGLSHGTDVWLGNARDLIL